MAAPLIRLVDVGRHRDFEGYTRMIEEVVASLVAQRGRGRHAEIEVIRTLDPQTLAAALSHPSMVTQISAHGDATPGDAGFYSHASSRPVLKLTKLHDELEEASRGGIKADCLIADACDTARSVFVRGISDCLAQPTVYIGTMGEITWWQGTLWSAAFYASFLDERRSRMDTFARAERAADAATAAYKAVAGGRARSPYVAKVLEPSRRARTSLRSP